MKYYPFRPQPKNTEPPEPYKTSILLGLIRETKPDGAVWCDGGTPRMRYEAFGEPWPVTWQMAAAITGVQVPGWPVIKKPPMREICERSKEDVA